MNKSLTYAGAAGAGILLLIFLAWFMFLRGPAQPSLDTSDGGFGLGDNRTITLPESSGGAQGENTLSTAPPAQQMVFKVSDGPITSATFVQTSHPTTTYARFVLQENGHVADLVLDSAGAVPRAVSNTTIPGAVNGVWERGGKGVTLQYVDETTVKTVHLGFPVATSSAAAPLTPVNIRFFPDNITSFAVSPSGTGVAYLLSTSAGSEAYIAEPDGSNVKKLFTLPLQELVLSWPAPNTQMLVTKSATGVPGAAFSVNAQSGGVVPLLFAPGLTVAADRSFAHIIYQNTSGGRARSYVHDTTTGIDTPLVFNPIPEKCAWSPTATSTAFCAVPTSDTPANYLDLWHKGSASLQDTILSFNFLTGGSRIITTPGTIDGGVASDILEMAVSPDERYLLFIKKGDRSLWGVRLGTSQ